MSGIGLNYDVLNQKGSPAWYSDTYANIPIAGYKGRMFISTDTFAFYRDNGTGWDLVGGPGTGTITGAGVSGQVTYFNGTDTIAGNNNFFWDITNSRLGLGTATPGSPLDIHSTGTNATFNGTTTNNAFVFFQNSGTSKWRIGNLYNSGANDYQIYDVLNATARLTIKNTGATTLTGTFTATSLIKSGGTSSQILLADGTTTPTSTFGAGSVTSVSALTLGTTGTDLSSSVANSTTTPVITLNVPTASASNRGALSSADWTTFNNKQATITLTTTGTSGAATLVANNLNIPNYTNVGTVTSVAALTLGTSGTDLSSSVANSTSTPVITLNVPTASATNRGALSSADFTTFNNKQSTISVTAPITLVGSLISMPVASTGANGYLSSTDWNTFNNKSNTNGTVTSVVALTIGTTGIDITSTAVTTTTTPVITLNIPTASASNRGALSSTDWTTFNNKQATLSLTTTGTSGVATLVANTLNVPNYGSALSGYLPLTGGTLTGTLNIQPNVASSSQGLYIQNNNTGGYGATFALGLYGYSTSAYFNTLSIESSYPGFGRTLFYTKQQSSSTPVLALNLNGNGDAAFGSTASFVGNVCINTTTAYGNSKLTLVASTNPTSASSNNMQLSIGENSANSGYSLKIGYVNVGGGYQGSIQSILGSTPYITSINPDGGSVGVGTYAPSDKLDVQGASGVGIRVSNSTNPGYNANLVVNLNDVTTMQLNCLGTTILQSGNTGNTVLASRTSIINVTALTNFTSRGNFLGATDNALFSLNSGGTLYTVGFSPTATASSTNTLTLTTGTTTWIYTGTGTATWTLPNPSGNNQIYWIKNAGTGIITLNAYSGTNIINNSATSVSSITIAVGATAVIAQDGNVKSYQLQ